MKMDYSKVCDIKYKQMEIFVKENNMNNVYSLIDTIHKDDYNGASKILYIIFENYNKKEKFIIENNISFYSDPICGYIEKWVEKYNEIVKSKDDIEDIYFRLFDVCNREEVDYDIFDKDGSYINIRKEFALE